MLSPVVPTDIDDNIQSLKSNWESQNNQTPNGRKLAVRMLVEYLHNTHKVVDSVLNMVKTQVFLFPTLRR